MSPSDDYNITFENGGLAVSPKNLSMAQRATCSFIYVEAAVNTPPTWIEHTSNGRFVCN